MLDALGDHKDVTCTEFGGAFLAIRFAQHDVELAVDHQEELIGVLMDVPDVLTRGVRHFDVVIIDPAHDPGAVDIVEGGQRLAEADGRDCHGSIITPTHHTATRPGQFPPRLAPRARQTGFQRGSQMTSGMSRSVRR